MSILSEGSICRLLIIGVTGLLFLRPQLLVSMIISDSLHGIATMSVLDPIDRDNLE